jgi:hypothetical protein
MPELQNVDFPVPFVSPHRRVLRQFRGQFASFAAAVTLVSCASGASGPEFSTIAPMQASMPSSFRLVVYRPKEVTNKYAYPILYVDGVERGALRAAGFVDFQVDTGVHTIKLTRRMSWDGTQEFKVSGMAGSTVYYRVGSAVTNIRSVGTAIAVSKEISITRVEDSFAVTELKGLRRSEQ